MLAQVAAALFLSALALAPVAAAVAIVSRSPFSPFQTFLWYTALALVKLRWRVRWEGKLDVPEGQGAVLVCNHRSSVDPFFIQTTTRRKTHWLVAREYVEHWTLAWFLKSCEVIPTARSGIDTAATKAAIRIAAAGGLVGMFPEGRINTTENLLLLSVRPGAALVALKAGVPIVPIYISGAPYRESAWSPLAMTARVTVRFGKPLDLREYRGREDEEGVFAEVLLRCLAEIAALAGQPEFVPQMAGRHWKAEEELAAAGRVAGGRVAGGTAAGGTAAGTTKRAGDFTPAP
jgi:1-acyl-sn-glycerol-3-phosphate acyltransferase